MRRRGCGSRGLELWLLMLLDWLWLLLLDWLILLHLMDLGDLARHHELHRQWHSRSHAARDAVVALFRALLEAILSSWSHQRQSLNRASIAQVRASARHGASRRNRRNAAV